MKTKSPAGLLSLLALLALAAPGSAAAASATRSVASEASQSHPTLSPELQDSVQQVIASKPGDLFVVLKNGLTLLLRQKKGNDVVSAQVFVRAGSLYEGDHLTAGLSHYLEHVVSGGSTNSFTEAEAKERLQRMGGVTNAYTSYDRTVYYINTSSNYWKDALDLLLSFVSESKIDPQETAREKSVIQQEIKLSENDPDRTLWRVFSKTAYNVHPVRNPVIGYEEVFIKQDREALLEYYHERYQPENIVVAVAGDIDPMQVIDFASKKTANFARTASGPVSVPPEPLQMSPRWAEEEVPIARLVQATVGFPSVSLHDKDLYALDVLAFLLGEGQTSRLNRRLKEQEKKVLEVGASNWTPGYAQGQLMISLALPPQNWPGVMKTIQKEIERFKTEPASAEELEKAKKAAVAQHIFGQESAASMASSLGSAYFDTGDPYFNEAYVEKLRRVTSDEIRDVANRYLRMDRMNVAVVRPPASQEETTAASQSPSRESLESSEIAFNRIENGLKVLLKRDSTLPTATIQLYGLGGLVLEDSLTPGISAFTASLLTAGTKERDRTKILRAIEDVGGSIEATSDNSTYHVSIKVLKEDLGMALELLSDIVRNSRMPVEEIERRRQETLLALRRIDESWQSEIVRLFKKSYFSHSPYEHDRLGTPEAVKAFTRDELLRFYRKMVNPKSSVLAVYGDFSPEEALKLIRSRFRGWTGELQNLPDRPDETRPLTTVRTVEKKNEKSSAALFIGANGIDIHSPKRPAMDVMSAIIAGASYPGGRLFEALRGKEDLVYLVGAFPFYGLKAGYYGVITQTTMGNLEKVQGIITANLKQLTEEPVSEAELAMAKDMLLIARDLEREEITAQARSAAVNEALGLGWEYDRHYPEAIRAVTSEEVRNLAKEIFSGAIITRTIPERPVEILAQPPKNGEGSAP